MRNTSAANLFLIVISVLFCICYANGDVIYVDSSATGGNNDGSNWGNAYLYLQNALTAASAGHQIWIAAGIYTPDKSNANPTGTGDRTASFVLKNLVEIHGGFAGTETALDQRVSGNETFLSGDLLGDDDPSTLVQNLLTDVTRAENSYHVITATLCGPPTVLEGVTVIGGQANGAAELGKGGGWYNITNSSPTVEKCIFTRNAATTRGGGWYMTGANCRPNLSEVQFVENYCLVGGGAAMLSIGSDVKLDNCGFYGNYATSSSSTGGGLYLDQSSPQLTNCEFSDNSAYDGGALAGANTSAPTITESSFTENSASYGGAIRTINCNMKFIDCLFTENTSTTYGGACRFDGSQDELLGCNFNGNSSASGGAIMIYQNVGNSVRIIQSVFYNNNATGWGGAIYNQSGHNGVILNLNSCVFIANYCKDYGGAIANYSEDGQGRACLTGSNCLFAGNYVTGTASCGGAVANIENGRYETHVDFTNSTFYANTAVNVGGGLFTNNSSNSTNTMYNCILWENSDTAGGTYDETAQIHGGANTVQYSCIQNLSTYAGNGNIGDDPEFVNPLGPDWIGGTLDDNLRLAAGSPCIDAGNGLLVPADLQTDLDGFPRCQDDPATADTGVPATNPPHDPNGVPDMGAYEFLSIDQPQWCDDNLKAAVEDTLGITNPNCLDMLNLTSLNISSKEITCLGGLECALNLTSLRANNNQIVDLTPISGCTKLQTLYLYSNDIEDISPLCGLVNLTYLHLAYNEITEIPSCLCNLNQLRSLYLYNNPISDLCPATCFTTLRIFYAYNIGTLPLNAYQVCIPQIKTNNPNLTDFRYDAGCVTMLEADVNDDCIVDLLDFAQLCSEWLSCTHMYPEMCP